MGQVRYCFLGGLSTFWNKEQEVEISRKYGNIKRINKASAGGGDVATLEIIEISVSRSLKGGRWDECGIYTEVLIE